MPTIQNAELAVTTHRPEDRALVIVSCDVQFTEVEVNAMDMLGLRYTLSCRILNTHLLDEDPVETYLPQTFPRFPGDARRYEHVVFESSTPMDDLHERLLGKDKLIAELTLTNDETGEQIQERTYDVDVDLAA